MQISSSDIFEQWIFPLSLSLSLSFSWSGTRCYFCSCKQYSLFRNYIYVDLLLGNMYDMYAMQCGFLCTVVQKVNILDIFFIHIKILITQQYKINIFWKWIFSYTCFFQLKYNHFRSFAKKIYTNKCKNLLPRIK